MLQPSWNQLRFQPSAEAPKHLDEFAELSTTLLHQAHNGQLELPRVNVRTFTDNQASRLILERPEWHPLDRELLAIHLGRNSQWLMVSFHEGARAQEANGDTYPVSTVVLEQGEAKVFLTGPSRVGPEELITQNEIAGRQWTGRLYRAFGYFGIYNSDELEKLKATG